MSKLAIGVGSLLGGLGVVAMIGCAAPQREAAAADAAAPEPQIDLAAEREAALQLNRVWLEKTRARDATGIGDLFVEQGWRMTGEEGVIDGRAAIVAALQKDMDTNPARTDDWGTKEAWVAASGDLAVERGWYRTDADGDGAAAPLEGEYVTVLVKRDGAWKILSDVSTPVGGVKPPI
jgi:uncharacterized protein (TIGR02246 family)